MLLAVTIALGVLAAFLMYKLIQATFSMPPRYTSPAVPAGSKTDEVVIHGAKPVFDVTFSPSPACGKVALFCKAAGIAYRMKGCQPNQGPKGKMPWITHGDNTVADSTFILNYLFETYADGKQTVGKFVHPSALSPLRRGIQTAVQRICEDSLYFCFVDYFWLTEQGAPIVKKTYFGEVPGAIRPIIFKMVQKSIFTSLYGQGIARHSREEVFQIFCKDIDALSELLGKDDFFGGDVFSSGDVSAFCHLDCVLNGVPVMALREYAKNKTNLVEYMDRIRKQFVN